MVLTATARESSPASSYVSMSKGWSKKKHSRRRQRPTDWKPKFKKGLWSNEEDELLLSLVYKQLGEQDHTGAGSLEMESANSSEASFSMNSKGNEKTSSNVNDDANSNGAGLTTITPSGRNTSYVVKESHSGNSSASSSANSFASVSSFASFSTLQTQTYVADIVATKASIFSEPKYERCADEKSRCKIDWTAVSEGLVTRSCKQCRERWVNHLNPGVTKEKWSEAEDAILLDLGTRFPKKWAQIAREMPGRSQNQVKIRWNSLHRVPAKPVKGKGSKSEGQDEDSDSESELALSQQNCESASPTEERYSRRRKRADVDSEEDGHTNSKKSGRTLKPPLCLGHEVKASENSTCAPTPDSFIKREFGYLDDNCNDEFHKQEELLELFDIDDLAAPLPEIHCGSISNKNSLSFRSTSTIAPFLGNNASAISLNYQLSPVNVNSHPLQTFGFPMNANYNLQVKVKDIKRETHGEFEIDESVLELLCGC